MAYPRSMLNDGEELVLDRNPHWSFMLGAMFMSLAAVLVTIVIGAFDLRLVWIGLLVMLMALIGDVGRFLRWKTTQLVITTDRIIVRSGILSKQGLEIPLERVNNISFHQALWERMLGTGDLIIESAGENGHQPFTDVEDPSGVQNLIYRQMELATGNSSPGAVKDTKGSSSETIPEQISRLSELRDDGILSDEEFEKKKRQLLERM